MPTTDEDIVKEFQKYFCEGLGIVFCVSCVVLSLPHSPLLIVLVCLADPEVGAAIQAWCDEHCELVQNVEQVWSGPVLFCLV
jgi:hypothetical protein